MVKRSQDVAVRRTGTNYFVDESQLNPREQGMRHD